MLAKEALMVLISEEKDNFSRYSQLCTTYQVQTDPLVMARHQGRLEILQRLLREKPTTKP
jgi:hypothetical protein